MAYSKSDISRIDKQRRAVPDKIYIENPDVYGRTQYYIGTNQFTLTPITQVVYNTLVGNNQVQATTSVTETDPVFTAWLAGPPNISIFNNDSGYLITVAVDGVTITGDGTLGNPLVAAAGGGTVWYTGAGAPVGLQNDGDFYLDSTNGDYYEQIAGAWVLQGSLLGPAGTNGAIQISTAAGTVDAITATYSPVLTLTDKVMCAFVATGANATTTPTFSPDGLTAHTIVKQGGQALVAGDIPNALAVCILEYNLANTRWELLNPAYGKTATNILKANFGATFNGQGGVITNSNIAVAEIVVPANGNITDFVIESYYMVAGVPTYLSGSIVCDLYSGGASIIGAGNKPTLTAASTASAAVAGWTTTTVTAGDKLFIHIVGSPVTCLVVTVTFKYTKT